MESWKQHIAADARHKLLFVTREVEGVSFVDVGAELSGILESELQNKRLAMIAGEAIDKIIDQHITRDADVGDYVAIRNIGILFEPILHINLHAKIDSWSKTKLLIVHHDGIIHNQIFYLTTTGEANYSLNLKDITHKSL